LRYGNQAAPIFGLPFAWPIAGTSLALFLKNRLWTVLVIGLLSILYYQNKIDIFNTVLISFAFILGVSGLYCQYLVWLVPCLLVTGWYRLSALYNLAVSLLFLLYYTNPLANANFPYEGMLSFSALHQFAWLMPYEWLTHPSLVILIRALTNYIIPIICLSICGYILFKALRNHSSYGSTSSPRAIFIDQPALVLSVSKDASTYKNSFERSLLKPLPTLRIFHCTHYYMITLMTLIAVLLILFFTLPSTNIGHHFEHMLAIKLQWYHIKQISYFVTSNFDQSLPFNIATIMIIGTLVWSWIAFNLSNRQNYVFKISKNLIRSRSSRWNTAGMNGGIFRK
jgi:hypothetical protein